MTDQTPSPQSVVVPVKLMTLSLKAAEQFIVNGIETGYVRLPDYDDDPAHSTLPLIRDALALLSVAPAPSSLAGGEVAEARARMFGGMIEVSNYGGLDNPQETFMADLRTILAALSPEAPARIVGTIAHVSNGRSELATQITAALTPRHEAPASEDEARRKLIERIDQWDSEMEYDAEDRASLADDILHAFNGPPVMSHEAPAEGAGERIDWQQQDAVAGALHAVLPLDVDWQHMRVAGKAFVDTLMALRARSSAPEAREGEAS